MFYLQIRKGDLPAFIVKIGQKKKDNSLCGLSTDNLYNKYNLDTLLFYLFTFNRPFYLYAHYANTSLSEVQNLSRAGLSLRIFSSSSRLLRIFFTSSRWARR